MTNNTSSIKYYDTVATMRSDSTLSFGNFVKTHGYHDITDGGGNLYKITNENVFASIKLDNGLYAAPKVSGQRVNVRAFGAEGTGYGKPRVNDTEAFNLAFNYAASNGLSVYIPSGKYYITPIQINDIDSMVVEGDGQYLSQIGAHDDASNSNSPLLKFLPKDNYAGAAISGFSMRNLRIFANRTNYISHDEVFKGTFVEISSLWDKCRFQEVFFDGCHGSALRILKRDSSQTQSYNILEGVLIDHCAFLGTDKKAYPYTSAPLLDFPDGGLEVNIRDNKFYIQQEANDSLDMSSLEAYEAYNSRSAINMAGNTQGWEINGNHFIPGMNCAVIRIHNGQMHRIYGNSFERFGQYNEVLTEDDKKNIGLIVWDSIVARDQITGGLIENNRMVYPIVLEKKYRIRADHINIREFAVEAKEVDLSGARTCFCEFTKDVQRELLDSESERNTVVNHSGSISQFSNKVGLTRRDDTGSNQENESYPTLQFDYGVDAEGKRKIKAFIRQDEYGKRLTIATKEPEKEEQRAVLFSQGCTILPQYYDTEGVSLNGALRYVDGQLLFRTNNEWKVVNLTEL